MTSRFQPPPIIKAIERLHVDVEQAVRTFTRDFRYDLGKDVRNQTMRVFTLANRACRDREQQAHWVSELVWAVDELRQYWQTCKRLGATRSFRQFEVVVRQIDAVGMQCGGWKRQLHPKAQNARDDVGAQRGQKLSTRATPSGVNP